MKTEASPLATAFTDDHRVFTRGLSRILRALRRDDQATAVALAEELDRAVGPHIEFEEQVFYPILVESLGKDFVRQLYREHRIGQTAVRALMAHPHGEPLPEGDREGLIEQLETAMDHALSCGTLLSHVTSKDPGEQQRLLDQLEDISRRGHRWTELPIGRRSAAAE